MLESTLEKFTENVFQFLTGEPKPGHNLLVKKHSEDLHTNGDFSFPNSVKPWYEFLGVTSFGEPEDTEMILARCIDQGYTLDCLIEQSKSWELTINKFKVYKGRVHVFLERNAAICVGLREAMENNEIISQKILEIPSFVEIDPHSYDPDGITSLRLKCLTESIRHLYSISSACEKETPNVFVTYKSGYKSVKSRVLLCAPVLNAATGVKEATVKANDFIRRRQNDMTLIAQHKYGLRVSTDTKWKEFTEHLGESAVTFELLQIKPCSPVKINFECCSTGSSKGVSFILYNCARLETILRTYNDKVKDGVYPPLPEFENTDFSLLTQEDEWNLIFNYILGFPAMLHNCVDIEDGACEFRPHLVCGFLSSMVRVISQYYRKIKILTEPRAHLLPVIFARIHMLRILNDTLKSCLQILNIKSVSQM